MFPLTLIRPGFKTTLAALVLFACAAMQSANAEEFTNFLGMRFLSIPGGTVEMGADEETSDARHDASAQHAVEIRPFQIMPTEVTLAQYKRYIIESSRIQILTDEFILANRYDDDVPVVLVSWNDASYFLHWLNKNKPVSDQGTYSLPTEAEWEYACRAGGDDTYCGGNTANEAGWNSSQNVTHQQPVAQKVANAFGLFDMSGNVYEWVMDCYHTGRANTPPDGSGQGFGCHPSKRIVRGGAWNTGPGSSRASHRLTMNITSRSANIGFRVVRRLP